MTNKYDLHDEPECFCEECQKAADPSESPETTGYALATYIASGRIYEDVPTGDSSFSEQGRDVWPERMRILHEMAMKVLEA